MGPVAGDSVQVPDSGGPLINEAFGGSNGVKSNPPSLSEGQLPKYLNNCKR